MGRQLQQRRRNEEVRRAQEGRGVNDEGGGWVVVPILQNSSVFPLFSLYYTDMNYSTTGEPLPLPADLTVSAKSTVCSFLSTIAGTPENKCSHLFSVVVGVLWSPTTHKPQHWAFMLVLGACGLAVVTTAYQQSHKPRNRAFVLTFGGCELSLGQRHCCHCQQPPEPSKSSVHTWFRVLLPSNPRNRAVALVFSGYGLSLSAATTTTAPVTPEIERECSLSVVLVFLWLPTSTTPKFEHSHLILGGRGCFWPLQLPQPIWHAPRNRARMLNFGGCGSATSRTAKLSTYGLDFAVHCIRYGSCQMYSIVFRWYQYILNENNFIGWTQGACCKIMCIN